ncbi:hypothetical protein MC7420_5017 [Coleofasciculus chthonoplastes PCC 7420]|uniref:Uncharacterized protein n=1 Tax=Coleofasciculus chthonoplastes PCC 7420 TaxID=118168 RepID=B4VZF0_9CYAN|nr:hypothetical protein MC7420_5017 [Coleofasciculus chthonoplastes PCC 7420]
MKPNSQRICTVDQGGFSNIRMKKHDNSETRPYSSKPFHPCLLLSSECPRMSFGEITDLSHPAFSSWVGSPIAAFPAPR